MGVFYMLITVKGSSSVSANNIIHRCYQKCMGVSFTKVLTSSLQHHGVDSPSARDLPQTWESVQCKKTQQLLIIH